MGHSRVSTTNEIYTHVELDRLVAATDGVERAIEGQAGMTVPHSTNTATSAAL